MKCNWWKNNIRHLPKCHLISSFIFEVIQCTTIFCDIFIAHPGSHLLKLKRWIDLIHMIYNGLETEIICQIYFFCVKNMTKMKYHADVIHSITQTWFSPNCCGHKITNGFRLIKKGESPQLFLHFILRRWPSNVKAKKWVIIYDFLCMMHKCAFVLRPIACLATHTWTTWTVSWRSSGITPWENCQLCLPIQKLTLKSKS